MMKRLLILLTLGLSVVAIGQTTVPTVQIVIPIAVAQKLAANQDTEADRQRLREAIQIALGGLGEQKANPCDKPASRLINDGRPVSNCTDSVEHR